MFDQTKVRGRAGEMNIFVESNWVMRLGRSSLKVLPFAAAAGVLGSWMVYPGECNTNVKVDHFLTYILSSYSSIQKPMGYWTKNRRRCIT